MSDNTNKPLEDNESETFTSSRGITYTRPVESTLFEDVIDFLLENTKDPTMAERLETLRIEYMKEANNQ